MPSPDGSQTPRPPGRRALAFVLLWLAGVTGMALIVLPFHLLMVLAMRH